MKLHNLKGKLKEWNNVIFGDVNENVQKAERSVSHLERIFDLAGRDEDRINLQRTQAELLKKLKESDKFWKQKSKGEMAAE